MTRSTRFATPYFSDKDLFDAELIAALKSGISIADMTPKDIEDLEKNFYAKNSKHIGASISNHINDIKILAEMFKISTIPSEFGDLNFCDLRPSQEENYKIIEDRYISELNDIIGNDTYKKEFVKELARIYIKKLLLNA